MTWRVRRGNYDHSSSAYASCDSKIWAIVSPLLDQALDLDRIPREQFVARVIASDPEAGAQLSRLLLAHDELSTSDFLDGEQLRGAWAGMAGISIGPYTLRIAARLGRRRRGLESAPQRRSLRRRRGGEAAAAVDFDASLRGAIHTRGYVARAIVTSQRRAPARRRRHGNRPALPGPRAHRRRSH